MVDGKYELKYVELNSHKNFVFTSPQLRKMYIYKKKKFNKFII